MKDKMKGLLLGVTIGMAVSGSAVYAASGTQIEVYFRSLKYMFDGVQKAPSANQGQGFIYNGTTYVPLRFVSEALGKEVSWDKQTSTIWVGRKVDLTAVGASYEGGTITIGEFEKWLAVYRFMYGGSEQGDTTAYKQSALHRMIGIKLLKGSATADMKASIPAETDAEMGYIRSILQDHTDEELNKAGITESELRSFIEETLLARAVIGAQIPVSELIQEQQYEAGLASYEYTKADVRHILVGNLDANGLERTPEEMDRIVKEIQVKLQGGQDFASLAAIYSDDPGSANNGGLYEQEPVSSWVEPFKLAVLNQELHIVGDPVKTEFGTHLIKVESRTTTTFQELQAIHRKQLSAAKLHEFIQVNVPALVKEDHVSNPS